MGAIIDLIKRNYSFSADEIKGIGITAFVIGFMFSYREWGIEKFDLLYGLRNLVSSILIVALVLLFYLSAEKIIAIIKGYRVEFQTWMYGIIIALIITFVSRGYLVLAFAGSMMLYQAGGLRLGKFRYAWSYKDLGYISLVGPISALLLATVFKFLMLIPLQTILLKKALLISIMIAFWNMIPIPPLNGSNVFFHSRTIWFLSFVGIAVASAFLYFYTSILLAIISGLIMALIGAALWFIYVEERF